MGNERAIGCECQVIGRALCAGAQGERGNAGAAFGRRHLPFVDPGGKGVGDNICLPGCVPCEPLHWKMFLRGGDRRMAQPKLRRAPTAAALGGNGRSEQRPLHPVICALRVAQIGRQIPPFDPKRGMSAMIFGKAEGSGFGQGKPFCRAAEASKALCLRGCGPGGQNSQKCCAPDHWAQSSPEWLSVHWQTPSKSQPGCGGQGVWRARRLPATPPARQPTRAKPIGSETGTLASASQRLRH